MKREWIPAAVVAGLLLLVLAGAAAVKYIDQFIPTKEKADLASLLEVTGEETALFYNDELLEVKGITRDGSAYLPLDWVNDCLNERFYWDDVEKMLVYTLPDTIVYADRRTMGSGDKPLLLVEDSGIYLSVGLISNYTDVRAELFTDGGANRLYLYDVWGNIETAAAGKEAAVRVSEDIKSPVITTVEKDGLMKILEDRGEWSLVRTDSGYTGYIQNKFIAGTGTEVRVSTFEEPVYTSLSLGEPVCLIWHQVLAQEDNDKLDRLISDTRGVNVISPTWFTIMDNNGSLNSFADRDYVDKVHGMGMQVWAAVDNFNLSTPVNSAVLFSQTSVRKKLIGNLLDMADAYDLDGINLDIEGISQEAMPHYVQFIREFSIDCRERGLILSVDNYVPTAYTAGYNRAEQGRVADYVIIMGYDEHYSGSEAGSVASLPFVEQGIVDTLKEVPAEKVINAIPFYTRVWTTKDGKLTSKEMGLRGAMNWVIDNEVALYWQEELGQYYGELRTEDSVQEIWQEEERSLGLKMDLIRKYDLAGVACWKLGLDMPETWDIVKIDE